MVKCVFCAKEIKKGTGTLYVFKTGKSSWFCSMKCQKNQMKLKRKPLHTRWSGLFRKIGVKK